MSEHAPLTEAERDGLDFIVHKRPFRSDLARNIALFTAVEQIVAARTSTATADTGRHIVTFHDTVTGLRWSCTCRATGAGDAQRVRETGMAHAATADTGLRERVEALADEWERTSPAWLDPVDGPVRELRAVLDATPASTEDRADNEGTPCGCWKCYEARGERIWHMVLCAICGNKRCPHAADHDLDCTGSNDTGQPGSAYEQGSGAASARRLADNEGTR